MNTKTTLLGILTLSGAIALSACKKDDTNTTDAVKGYLYTSTNGEGMNSVVRFSRHDDGSITDEKAFSTTSLGGANVKVGGDAHGDFDSQGAVQIIGNYLLVTNAGGNDISVFALDRPTGDLTFKSKVASGGTRPVSIAYTPKSGSADEYWVVVGNQWNNPNVQKDGASIERYPNNAFYQQNLTLPDATDNERNIQLFTFNSSTGVLTSVRQLDKYVRENGGPASVSFSNDGSKIAVTTWGIAHCHTFTPVLTEQHPSRVYIYSFANGNTSARRFFEETGIAGSIGHTWEKTGNSKLYVSNFNLIPAKFNNSVTLLTDNGTTVTKTANSGVTTAAVVNEACWTVPNAAGDKLYVASFDTNLTTAYNISGGGLTYLATEHRRGLAPNGDSKELWLSPDNKYLYNLGGLQSFSIIRFDVEGNSVTYKTQTILNTTADGAGIAGKYNFLGLVGYDK